MKLDAVRKYALSLPETTEAPHFDMSSFRVRGKIFCTIPSDRKRLHISVDPLECEALLAEGLPVFEEIIWGKNPKRDFIRVYLAKADPAQVRELLEDAWRMKAPKRLVADYDVARG